MDRSEDSPLRAEDHPTRPSGQGATESPRPRAEPADEPPEPTSIGRYRIVRRLGTGGMGVVYLAYDDRLDRKVAIKVLSAGSRANPVGSARLIREAQAMAKLSHPNVAHVYEVGQQDDVVFIAMEYIPGETLREWCRAAKTPAEIIAAHLGAGRGLVAAHAAGLIHRDYKPQNVLVTRAGQVKVLDFGLARAEGLAEPSPTLPSPTDSPSTSRSLTKTGTVLGTPAYMAPEQMEGRSADARSDQYSFCVTLFEALYGHRPVAGTTMRELYVNAHRGRLRAVNPDRAGVPRATHAALLRGLSLRPEDRHPSMKALQQALQPTGRGGRTRRRWPALGLGLAGTAALVVALRGPSSVAPPAPTPSASTARAQLLSSSALPPTRSEPHPDDPYGVTTHRLDNGLTVFLAPDHDAPMVTAAVVVRAGTVDESPGATGVAHFLEHSLFDGTAALGALDYSRERPLLEQRDDLLRRLEDSRDPGERDALLQSIEHLTRRAAPYGAPSEFLSLINALGGTNFHSMVGQFETVYFVDLPRARLSAWAALEAELLSAPVYRSFFATLVNLEQEFRINVRNGSNALYLAQQALFAGTAYQHSSFGHGADLGRPPFSGMRDFHRDYYVPNNTAIVLVGDVDAETVLPIIEHAFGRWEPRAIPPRPPPPAAVSSGRIQQHSRATWTSPVVSWPVPTDELELTWVHVDRVLEVLGRELDERLRDNGTCSSVSLDRFSVMLVASLIPAPGVDEATAESRLFEAIEHIHRAGPRPQSIQEASVARRKETIEHGRSTVSRATEIANAYGRRHAWADVTHARSAPVTEESTRALAGYLLESTFVAIHRGDAQAGQEALDVPQIGDVRYPMANSSDFADRIMQIPSTVLEPHFILEGRHYATHDAPPQIAREIDDGLTTLTLEYPRLDRDDPWTCELVELWAASGTRERTHAQQREHLARFGASIRTHCSATEAQLTLEVLDAHAEDVRPAFERWLSAPELRPEDLERRERERAATQSYWRQADHLVADALHAFAFYGDQSRYLIDAPDGELAAARSLGDLSSRLRELRAEQPRVIYSGAAVRPFALPPASRPLRPLPPRRLPAPSRPRIVIMDDSSEVSADIGYSLSRGPMTSGDHLLADLLTDYLADGRTGALDHELRAVRSLVYHSYAQVLFGARPRDDTTLLVETSTPHEQVAAVIEVIASVLQRPIDADGLASARTTVETRYRGRRFEPSELPFEVARWQQLGFDADPLLTKWPRLPSVTAAQLDAFKDSFTAQPPIIMLRGDLDRIGRENLERFGDVEVVTLDQIFGRG